MYIPLPILVFAVVAIIAMSLLLVLRGRDPRGDLIAPPRSTRTPPLTPMTAASIHPEMAAHLGIGLPPQVREEVMVLIGERRMIAAVKRVREETGLGLREAKELVDALRGV